MENRTLLQGEPASWSGSFEEADESPINMTTGTRHALLRITSIATGSVLELDTDTLAHWTWTDEANGEGRWTLTGAQTAALDEGDHTAECIYYDENGNGRRVGKARYYVEVPVGGSI